MRRGGDPIGPVERPVGVRVYASLDKGLGALAADRRYWGFLTTPSEARLLHRTGEEWRSLLTAEPWLEEARLFNEDEDFHWLAGRGVLLRAGSEGSGAETVIESPRWLARKRRSRLWGEWLQNSETWYEERIPNPQVYEGVEPGPANDYVFLRYLEYLEGGQVRQVRYLGLVGEAR